MEVENEGSSQVDTEIQTSLKKYQVIVRHFDNYTYQEISQETGYGKGTISKIIKKFNEHGDVNKNLHNNAGRKPKMDEEDKALVENILENNNRATLNNIQLQLQNTNQTNVSISTINRFQNEIGSFQYPIERPILSQQNKVKRLEYANNDNGKYFGNVIFTDESYFTINRLTQKVFIFYDSDPPIVGHFNPFDTVMIWGVVCRRGKIALEFINERINQQTYLSLLQRHFPHKANQKYGVGKWKFQHDNTPSHTARTVKQWIQENTPSQLSHPPQSPDLNPIELVWSLLKRDVEKQQPSSKQQLIQCIQNSWDNIQNDTINSFIDHLANVMDQIREKNGDNTVF